VSAFIIGLLLLTQSATAQNAPSFTSKELASRTVYRRAVDAVIWGAPVVTLDMMRQGTFATRRQARRVQYLRGLGGGITSTGGDDRSCHVDWRLRDRGPFSPQRRS